MYFVQNNWQKKVIRETHNVVFTNNTFSWLTVFKSYRLTWKITLNKIDQRIIKKIIIIIITSLWIQKIINKHNIKNTGSREQSRPLLKDVLNLSSMMNHWIRWKRFWAEIICKPMIFYIIFFLVLVSKFILLIQNFDTFYKNSDFKRS